MSDPTKVIVYVAPQWTWLPFVDVFGFPDALELSKPMRLVAERDYAKLAQGYATLRAERDALRKQAEAAEAERDVLAEKWGGMVDDHGDPLDASGILEYVCTLREELSHMTAERDALRKDAVRLDAARKIATGYSALDEGSLTVVRFMTPTWLAFLRVMGTDGPLTRPFMQDAKCYDYDSCGRNQRCMYGKIGSRGEWENCFTPPHSPLDAALAVQPLPLAETTP